MKTEDEDGNVIEICDECGEIHLYPWHAPLVVCVGCGKQFHSYQCKKCLQCHTTALMRIATMQARVLLARESRQAQPKRQAVPDVFYRAFE